ncbi:Uncharacterised protein [uncultured archaeon]|nr:Uncharacterised protein [uncultured archaeon]
MFFMAGCIDKSPQYSSVHSEGAEIKEADELCLLLQVDYDAEVRKDLFRVRGNLVIPGNSSLSYLLLNATLRQGDRAQKSTKYLMLQPESGKDLSFEISKNMRISPGDYNCLLEISGPNGPLGCETRVCRREGSWTEPFSATGTISDFPASINTEEEISEKERTEDDIRHQGIDEAKVEKSPARESEAAEGPENGSGQSSIKNSSDEPAKKAAYSNARQKMGSAGAASAFKEEGAMFVGSKGSSSKKYHRPDCRFVTRIKEKNRIYFQSAEDAKGQGYLPCKICNP